MRETPSTVKNRHILPLDMVKKYKWALLAFLVAGILFFARANSYREIVTNIDGVSYMSIASQYAEFDIRNAVNAFWSPLVSIFMVPFLWLGFSQISSFLIVNALTSLFILFLSCWLVYHYTKNRIFTLLTYISLLPFLISTMHIQTPDLLVVSWCLIFVTILLTYLVTDKTKDSLTTRRLALLGFLGAVGYLTKQFLIPYFFISLLGILVFHEARLNKFAIRNKLRSLCGRVAKRYLKVTTFFILFSLPWIILLSLKYDRVTLGSSFSVNILRSFTNVNVAAEYIPRPPNDKAVTYGEDRTPAPVNTEDGKMGSATSGGSERSFVGKLKDYAYERAKALPFYVNKVNGISIAIVLSYIIYIAFFTVGIIKREDSKLHILIWLSFVYFLGYAMITYASTAGGNTRYYWPLLPMAFVFWFILLDMLAHIKGLKVNIKAAHLLVFVILPLSTILNYQMNYDYLFTLRSDLLGQSTGGTDGGRILNPFARHQKMGEDLFNEYVRNHKIIPEGSKMISNVYRPTVGLAFHTKSQLFGVSGRGYELNSQTEELYKSIGIEYFVRYTPSSIPHREREDLEDPYASRVIADYRAIMPCEDVKSASRQECSVDIIKLDH